MCQTLLWDLLTLQVLSPHPHPHTPTHTHTLQTDTHTSTNATDTLPTDTHRHLPNGTHLTPLAPNNSRFWGRGRERGRERFRKSLQRAFKASRCQPLAYNRRHDKSNLLTQIQDGKQKSMSDEDRLTCVRAGCFPLGHVESRRERWF